MDNIRPITEANRQAWNQAIPVHRNHRKVNLHEKFTLPGFSCLDSIETEQLLKIGLSGKKVAQLCCNNGREILSIVNLGAHEGVGFDISDEAIKDAGELASNARANCRFVRTDVYDIGDEWNETFDLVYITIGALSWLPDLQRFFAIAERIMRPGGDLAIYEQHPILSMYATPDDQGYDSSRELAPVHSYFRTEPWIEYQGIDYVGKTKYESSPSYNFTQKLSDILNPIASAGLILRVFNEYPHDISALWDYLEKYRILPLCYFLVAKKPDHRNPAR